MSAFGGKADIAISELHVCFWPQPVLSLAKIPHCNTRPTRSRMAPRC